MVARMIASSALAVLLVGTAGSLSPATAQVPCLYIPIFGPDDQHSTCLVSDQMERRAIVLQCAELSGQPIKGSRATELAYIITGERSEIGTVAKAGPNQSRFRCIWERSGPEGG